MACSTSTTNILIEPVRVSWGRFNEVCVTAVADVASSLQNLYFEISDATVDYYVWFNVGGAGVDPAVAGKTGIEVTFVADSSAATIVAAIKTAVELSEFYGTVSGDSINIFTKVVGAVNAVAAASTSTFTVATDVTGLGGDLGATDGGVEVALEVTSVDFKTDQAGETLVGKGYTGNKVTVSTTLQEMTSENWALIVGSATGDAFTPSAGTELIGFGTSKVGESFFNLAGRLILTPVNAVDNSRCFTIPKCVPMPESINYSGTETQKMGISFESLIDGSIDTKINMGFFGDPQQDLR